MYTEFGNSGLSYKRNKIFLWKNVCLIVAQDFDNSDGQRVGPCTKPADSAERVQRADRQLCAGPGAGATARVYQPCGGYCNLQGTMWMAEKSFLSLGQLSLKDFMLRPVLDEFNWIKIFYKSDGIILHLCPDIHSRKDVLIH